MLDHNEEGLSNEEFDKRYEAYEASIEQPANLSTLLIEAIEQTATLKQLQEITK